MIDPRRRQPTGWRNEPVRHSLASRGVKTTNNRKEGMLNFLQAKQKEQLFESPFQIPQVATWALNMGFKEQPPLDDTFRSGVFDNTKNITLSERRQFFEKAQKNQKNVNAMLFDAGIFNGERVDPQKQEILTITVLKTKSPLFDFLTNRTQFDTTGRFQGEMQVFEEEQNLTIQVAYLDTPSGSLGRALKTELQDFNKNVVGEEALFTVSEPVEDLSLPLDKFRDITNEVNIL